MLKIPSLGMQPFRTYVRPLVADSFRSISVINGPLTSRNRTFAATQNLVRIVNR